MVFNPAAELLFGRRCDEALGQDLSALAVPAVLADACRTQVELARRGAVAQPTSEVVETSIRPPDGRERPVDVTVVTTLHDGVPFVTFILRDVSARREREEQLRQRLNILEAIAEDTTDSVFVKDPTGRYLLINSAGARFLGRRAEEVVGRRNEEMVAADSVDALNEGSRRVLAGATLTTEDTITAGGVTRVYHTVKAPLRDAEGNVVGLIGIARDVTEQRSLERELRQRKELLQTVLDNIPAMVAIFAANGELSYLNATGSAVMGWSPEEARTIDLVAELYPDPQDRSRVVEFVGEASGKWEEFRMRARDGRALDASWANVRLSDGRLLGIGVDVSARTRGERQLREVLQALEDAGEGIARLDANGLYANVNAAYSAALGRSAPSLVGQEWTLAVHPDDLAEMRAAYERLRRDGRAEAQARGVRADGTVFHQSVTLVEIRSDGEPSDSHYCFMKDVSEHERLKALLLHSQKMEAVGNLAGGVAHDFNNMLAVINGYSEMLLTGTRLDGTLRGWVEEIGKAGGRAADLTRQLLAFSRRQLLAPKVLDLNQCLRDVDTMLRRLIGEDVELVTLLEPDLGKIEADPSQIEQMIVNLAVNARDAMPRGGRLVLRTRNADAAEIKGAGEAQTGAHVVLDVEDTGCGMAPELLERIFEPFFTTKKVGKGTGLGLSTVFGSVKQSGGSIDVESEPGRGSRFSIYLPRVVATAAEPHDLPPPALPTGNETILLVEDEPMVRTMIRRVLGTCGYTVLEATHGEEALRIAAAHVGPLDLLLTDVVMPKMSGRELAEQLTALRPACRCSSSAVIPTMP